LSPSTLIAGTRLGPYEILSALGAGGMGEVYRGRDTKLNRDVAIKILLPAVANDPDRLARFSREAQILASLNHPNIAHIYGLERQDGRDGQDRADATSFLVMELVGGEDLAERLARGRIALDEALPIAKQIAEALEAAHDQGIVHRDLKPANIKLRGDGTVKVLDFGLAKALDSVGPAEGGPHGATLTSPAMMTGAGIILGTAAYMAPEQARGRIVDRRADIWAFGVVLFEMLSGTRAFDADDMSAVLAFVITKDPDWTALPADTPAPIRTLLRRCLEKDPKRRLQAIGDARLEIEEALAAPAAALASAAAPPSSSRRQTIPLVLGAALATALVAAPATWMLTKPAPSASAAVTRFTIAPPPAQPLSTYGASHDVAISPDGVSIVYRSGPGRQGQLAMRRLDQLEGQLLTGTTDAHGPFFSPDGRWIGFFADGEMRKVSITGGPPVSLGGVGIGTRGASWQLDNTIVFGTDVFSGLESLPAEGGGATTIRTKSNPDQHEIGHWFPSALPEGRGVLYTIASGDAASAQIAVLDLKSGAQKTLIRGGSNAQYVSLPGASGRTGCLVYAVGGALRAVRFDLTKLEMIGDPVPVLDHVMVTSSGAANFTVSPGGTLVYVPGTVAQSDQRELVWVDRSGREEPIGAPPRAYVIPRISPDGTRVAIQLTDQERDIWTWDLARRALTRVTFDPGLDVQPVWTTDGRRIIFASGRRGPFHLFWHAADGTGSDELLTEGANHEFANSVTPDGAHVIGYDVNQKGASAIVRFPLSGASPAQRPRESLVQTPTSLLNVEMSPDGRFLAYESDESGVFEIYVRPYPNVNDARWQVSAGGGVHPAWARSGRELFFIDPAGALISAAVQSAGATFSGGKPVVVIQKKYATPLPFRSYDVSPDGQRFLMLKDTATETDAVPTTINVVLNWTEELRTKLAAK
jgi:serine/threonine protein kinase/Tol biopolymer transport system component